MSAISFQSTLFRSTEAMPLGVFGLPWEQPRRTPLAATLHSGAACGVFQKAGTAEFEFAFHGDGSLQCVICEMTLTPADR